ncbi:MAG: twin-arginine translocase TatA/TatE family subunit [Myxococcaceae bacterium]|nr:twin-arginine translocase TatA/TatE family subunit [Myxococcaceae bacterium]
MPQDTLPPRLQALLDGLTDRHLAERLEHVCRAAAVAVERLSHLNIIKYEPTTVEPDGADLSLWETMAPALRDTVVDVNHLISVIRQQFPAPERAAGKDSGWRPPPASADERLGQEVEVVLQTSAERLARRVAELGERVRRPEVVTDRWALMTELQAFRLDFRSRIGDLVYLTATAFGDVSREEVVPGHGQQEAAAVALRGAAVDLRRSLQGKLERVARTGPEGLPALARQLEESLGAFATMSASLTLRMRDKQELVELRERLRELASQPRLEGEELPRQLQPFLATLERVAEELTHQVLTVHDRTVWAACGARLEQASMHLYLGSPGAERVLLEALDRASELYGRSAAFDTFLRKNRRAPGEGLEEAQLRETLEMFRERLAALPFH